MQRLLLLLAFLVLSPFALTQTADYDAESTATLKSTFATLSQTSSSEIETLLANGADPNARDESGATLLYYAARSGAAEIVEVALKAGAFLDSANVNNETPLYLAIGLGHLEIADRLLSAGADPSIEVKNGYSPILVAAFQENLPYVEKLLAAGAPPDPQTYAIQYTALIGAIAKGRLDIAQILLEAGADINFVPRGGMSPLTTAISANNIEALEFLIDWSQQEGHPALQLDEQDGEQYTPVYRVSAPGYERFLYRLIEAGASPEGSASGLNKEFPIHRAVVSNSLEALHVFIDAGAQIDAKDKLGQSALVLAVILNRTEAAQTLLEAGAELKNVRDQDGSILSLLDFANKYDRPEIAALIERHLVNCHGEFGIKGWEIEWHPGVVKVTPASIIATGGKADDTVSFYRAPSEAGEFELKLRATLGKHVQQVWVDGTLLFEGLPGNLQNSRDSHTLSSGILDRIQKGNTCEVRIVNRVFNQRAYDAATALASLQGTKRPDRSAKQFQVDSLVASYRFALKNLDVAIRQGSDLSDRAKAAVSRNACRPRNVSDFHYLTD